MNRLSLAIAFAGLQPALHAQEPPYQVLFGNFDHSLDLAGDVDLDGVGDLVVGGNGQAVVVSGATGAILRAIGTSTGPSGYPQSSSVAGTGDVDLDGWPDLAIGSPHSGSGQVALHSGKDGSLIRTYVGDSPGDKLGFSVANAGDVDVDGVPDLIAGAPEDDDNGDGCGMARVWSGSDGAVLFTWYGSGPSDHLGWAVDGIGDVDGDGRGELIISSVVGAVPAHPNAVYIRSGMTGTLLYRLTSGKTHDDFGWRVSGLGDVDADGWPDFGVAALALGPRARVYSGPDGTILHSVFWTGGDAVAAAGDYDADGHQDFVVTDAYDLAVDEGELRVYSGFDKQVLAEFQGPAYSRLGLAAVGGIDLNGDGKPDYVASADGFPSAPGALYSFLGGCEQVASYCTAGSSAAGCQATLTATGMPSSSAASGFVVSAADAEGGLDGLFYFGVSGRQASPWGSGTSYQCVVPPYWRGDLLTGAGTPGACDGAFGYDLNARWAAKPSQAPDPGAVAQIQLWYHDPSSTSGQMATLSDALEVTVCP